MDSQMRLLEREAAKNSTPENRVAAYYAAIRAGQDPIQIRRNEISLYGFRVMRRGSRISGKYYYVAANNFLGWRCAHHHQTNKQAARCAVRRVYTEEHRRAREGRDSLRNNLFSIRMMIGVEQ